MEVRLVFEYVTGFRHLRDMCVSTNLLMGPIIRKNENV